MLAGKRSLCKFSRGQTKYEYTRDMSKRYTVGYRFEDKQDPRPYKFGGWDRRKLD